jgi:iron-sulfur cluster assembly protein
MITLTPKAVKAVRRFAGGSEKPVFGIRISVSGGGCAGLQYGVTLESEKQEDDLVLEVEGIKVLLDPLTAPMVEGVTVDFYDTITGTGFKFDNPNASASCACGQSFSA